MTSRRSFAERVIAQPSARGTPTDGDAEFMEIVGNKVIFNVGGNKYRMVGLVAFRSKRIYVLFVGTHAQYDATDVNKL